MRWKRISRATRAPASPAPTISTLNITVRLQIVDANNRVSATVDAAATRSRTVAADTTLNDRERVWFSMTEQAMRDLNATLEKNIPLYLGAYLR